MADESPQSAASDDDTASAADPPAADDTDRTSTPDSARNDGTPSDDEPAGTDDAADPEGDRPRQPDAESADDPPSSTTDPAGAVGSPSGPTTAGQTTATVETDPSSDRDTADDVPPDVRQYDRFKKIDGARYERVNEFLRDRTYITAREWAIARLCADFRTETGSEMTKIGENLPELVPFMTDTYTPQAVNQARSAFEDKVRKAGATFLYGAMCDFFTADQLDEVMYEATEVAKFLLEVEGVDLAVEEELEAEDRISSVMREVRHASESLRYEGVECPHCGEEIDASGHDQ